MSKIMILLAALFALAACAREGQLFLYAPQAGQASHACQTGGVGCP